MDHLIIPSDAMISFPSAGAKISSKIVLNPLITRSIWTAWRRDFFVALWNEKVDKFNHLKKGRHRSNLVRSDKFVSQYMRKFDQASHSS